MASTMTEPRKTKVLLYGLGARFLRIYSESGPECRVECGREVKSRSREEECKLPDQPNAEVVTFD
ncbi:hypothetical protein D6D21_02433 [Aureobasidium pullulans]|uniref:Uncharacterized protein n=1 Tax=Aureobasidium pullulans TaxID=5580 RepID=A0AB74J5U9_AURPU|nr:hypothetical protein D6D21_02433 [Aureobasidium pullulans]THX73046.1 hypothetical protein D6D04_08750 [Aureobasidium pullulans]